MKKYELKDTFKKLGFLFAILGYTIAYIVISIVTNKSKWQWHDYFTLVMGVFPLIVFLVNNHPWIKYLWLLVTSNFRRMRVEINHNIIVLDEDLELKDIYLSNRENQNDFPFEVNKKILQNDEINIEFNQKESNMKYSIRVYFSNEKVLTVEYQQLEATTKKYLKKYIQMADRFTRLFFSAIPNEGIKVNMFIQFQDKNPYLNYFINYPNHKLKQANIKVNESLKMTLDKIIIETKSNDELIDQLSNIL